MKKTFCMLLIFALCLGLCACGASAPAATAETPESDPTPVPVVEVKITLDNYLDYFEIVTEVSGERKDAYGNLVGREREIMLRLKDELACDPQDRGEITVGVEYDQTWTEYNKADADFFDTFTSSGSVTASGSQHESEQNTSCWRYDEASGREYLVCSLAYELAESDNDYVLTVEASNINIVNVTGTIRLLDA